jgi:hypothetical protein
MTRTRRVAIAVLVGTFLLGAPACSSGGTDSATSKDGSPPPSKGELPPIAERYADFDPAAFDASSADIDHRYLPLAPGTRLVLEGSDRRGKTRQRHRIEIIVTDLVQQIDAVDATVVWERDFVDDTLEEAELAYRAQDMAGNVWHLGEYSEVYEDDELVGATGFLQGYLGGARAGIVVPAEPRSGTPSYSEGYAPAPINWADRGRVVATGRRTKVPAGEYDDVLVVEEYSEDELSSFQLKYYAPGVGNVRVGWRGEDATQETLVLVRAETLDASALDAVRAEAGALEERARMYGTPPPARRRAVATS